jgi:hypothetical protein
MPHVLLRRGAGLALALLVGGFAPRGTVGDDAPPPPPSSPADDVPQHPPAGRASVLAARLEAVRHGDGGPLGEHDFLLSLTLRNPSAEAVTIRAGNVLLRSEGGWLSALAPVADLDMFARKVSIPAGGEQKVELEKPYKVLGPALDALVMLETDEGYVRIAAPLRAPGAEATREAAPFGGPLGLGVHHPLEAVAYADGPRSIVVVGQIQLLARGVLTKVEGSLVVGGDAGTTAPVTWSGGVEDGDGPGLWPFVQRVDVPNDFAKATVSVRVKAELDGVPVSAALDLPAASVEPFLCDGPVLDHWQLANGPAERRLHANLLQLRSRYAWDFVILKDGQTYDGDVSDNQSYFAWQKSIYAVADGEVVDLCDHQADRSGAETSLAPCVHTPVNRVVLKHPDGTHTAYLHIRQDSARNLGIKKGSKVKAGKVIALVGNSGASSEPHLMFFAFRHTADGALAPVPVAFKNAFADPKGKTPIHGVPEGGSQVHFLDARTLKGR